MFGTNTMFNYKNFLRELKINSIDFFSRKNFELFVFLMLVSFFDLFFAIMDDTCVCDGIDKLVLNDFNFEINLSKYLIGYSTIFLIGYFNFVFSSMFFDEINNPMLICSGIFFNLMSSTPLFLYNLIGGLIFILTDNSECSDILYIYMCSSLSCKYIFYFLNKFSNHYDRNFNNNINKYKFHYN